LQETSKSIQAVAFVKFGLSESRLPVWVKAAVAGRLMAQPAYRQLWKYHVRSSTYGSCQQRAYALQQMTVIRSPHQRGQAASVERQVPRVDSFKWPWGDHLVTSVA
jgi:hypothetical protein